MPIVRIDLRRGRPPNYVRAIGDAVHRALIDCLDVLVRDRFHEATREDWWFGHGEAQYVVLPKEQWQ